MSKFPKGSRWSPPSSSSMGDALDDGLRGGSGGVEESLSVPSLC